MQKKLSSAGNLYTSVLVGQFLNFPDLEDFELDPLQFSGEDFPDKDDFYASPDYFYSSIDDDLLQEAVDRYDE